MNRFIERCNQVFLNGRGVFETFIVPRVKKSERRRTTTLASGNANVAVVGDEEINWDDDSEDEDFQ